MIQEILGNKDYISIFPSHPQEKKAPKYPQENPLEQKIQCHTPIPPIQEDSTRGSASSAIFPHQYPWS